MPENDFPVPVWLRTKNGVAFADIPVRPNGRMADFCIIGSAKCGTTTLAGYLSGHPRVFMSDIKEPHYFSSRIMLERGTDWYTGLFANAGAEQICGEASTSYTRHPLVDGTAERMYRANPAMKLIYIVRNPVDRVESEALQTMKYLKNVVGKDFSGMRLDDFLDMIENPTSPYYSAIVDSSKFALQIQAFERFFPIDQILLLTQRGLREDTAMIISQICDFLRIDPHLINPEIGRQNVTSEFLTGRNREQSAQQLRRSPLYGLARRLLPRRVKDRLLDIMSRSADPKITHLSADLRKRLETGFLSCNRAFEKRLGRPWTDW